jgi:hypothetical protein
MWSPAGEVEDRERLGGLTRGDRESARDADGGVRRALEAGDAGLEHRLRGVHDARVDVADLGEREQVGGVRAVANSNDVVW